MSWHPSPTASSSSSRPLKRQRIKEEDEQISLWAIPPTPGSTQSQGPALASLVELMELADEQKTTLQIIIDGNNVFLTGCAGSGKTVVLKIAIGQLRDLGKRVRIAAPTGKAAQGVGGTTLHSLFGLTPKKMEQSIEKLEKMVAMDNSTLRQRLEDIDVLIIDEISMVENNFFERLNRMMQAAKDSDDAFGGIQLIVCGDFRQLSPVKPFSYCFRCGKEPTKSRDRERKTTIYRCNRCVNEAAETDQWAFCSQAWGDANFINIMLRENHRQNELQFVDILNKLAEGMALNRAERNLLYSHDCDDEGAILLYPTNAEVDAKNSMEVDMLQSREVQYDCVDYFHHVPQHWQYENFGLKTWDKRTLEALKDHPYRPKLQLKIGMPVVLIVNLDVERGLVNGSQGYVTEFVRYNATTLPKQRAGLEHFTTATAAAGGREINMRGEQYSFRLEQVKEFIVSQNNNVDLPVVQFHNGKKITVFPDCSASQLGDEWPYSLLSRTQLPLVPGWAMTVHKSQGMTMDKVVVNLSNMFCPGQAYVALSRARTLHGLKVEGSEKGLDAAEPVPEVMEFMRDTIWYVE